MTWLTTLMFCLVISSYFNRKRKIELKKLYILFEYIQFKQT